MAKKLRTEPLTDDERRWLTDTASELTRDAARIVGLARLHRLLILDGVGVGLVDAVREHHGRAIDASKDRAARHDELATLAATFREAFLSAVQTHQRDWERATRQRPRPEQYAPDLAVAADLAAGPRLDIVLDVHHVTGLIEATATRIAGHARADVKRFTASRPRTDEKGARADVPRIRSNLSELRKLLPARWTKADIATLIVSSSTDWRDPPCPGIVDRYRVQEGLARGKNRQASPLEAWITTHVSRAAKRKRA